MAGIGKNEIYRPSLRKIFLYIVCTVSIQCTFAKPHVICRTEVAVGHMMQVGNACGSQCKAMAGHKECLSQCQRL